MLPYVLLCSIIFAAPIISIAQTKANSPFSTEILRRFDAAYAARATIIMDPAKEPLKLNQLSPTPTEDSCPMCPKLADFDYHRFESGLNLDLDETEKLAKHLAEASPIDIRDRFNSCKFQPGMNITFYHNSGSTTVLVCLNCDVWAITTSPVKTSGTPEIIYADARPYRSQLLELKNRLNLKRKSLENIVNGSSPSNDGEITKSSRQ